MQILGWPLLLSWACLHSLGENPGLLSDLPYSVRPAFKSCPCKGGGACLLREEYHQGNTRTYEEFTYEGKTYFGPKIVRVDTGSCYCNQLSKKYFAAEGGECSKLMDFCSNVTCKNGGTCRNKLGFFFCDSCSAGFGGQTCSLRERPLVESRPISAAMKFAQDITVVWYPNSDFQHTSDTWFKISVSETGTEFELWIEYLGISFPIDIPPGIKTDESKICFAMKSEDEVCKTYVKGPNNKLDVSLVQIPIHNQLLREASGQRAHESFPGRTYYTWNISTKSSPHAAPYNLIFGPSLEKALEILDHPKDWPFQIYAVKYPPIKISMYNSNTETFVQEFSMWSQVSSQTAGCYPGITFEGCSADAKRPFMYLSNEFVKIRAIVRKRSVLCKNLVAKLMQPIEFFEAEDTPMPKRLYNFKNGQAWQNDEDLSFAEKEKHFFKFSSFYTAAFGIDVLGSYQSVIGEELQLHFNAMCFFKIAPPHTEVTVEGGSGTYACSKPVEFLPLQTDDDFDTAAFTLRWSCVDLRSPNSSDCIPIETSWGSITYRNLACDRIYLFKLEPFHDYFRLTSPTKSDAGKPFTWTVRTALGVTHMSIKCKNSCVNVITQNSVELEATESPSSGLNPFWRIYEGNGTSPLPLDEYTNILGNKWFMSIRENALEPGATYRILVETERGRSEIVFETNSPPKGGKCSVVPSIGIKGITEFTVTCQNWTHTHHSILYTVGVIVENEVFVPLVDSFYPDSIPPFVLFSKNTVQVVIQDKFGLSTKYPLKVMLLDLHGPSLEGLIGKVKTLNGQLSQDFKTIRSNAVRSAMVAYSYEDVEASKRTDILGNIREIMPFARTLSDLNIVPESTRLVLSKFTKRGPLEDGVSDLILAAGQNIALASDVLQNLCKNRRLKCSLENPHVRSLVETLVQAVAVLFQTRDPHLYEDTLTSLDLKEIHQQKVKRGAKSALDGLSHVLDQIRASMVPDFEPFKFTAGKITAFTAVGHAKTLQTQLDAFGEIAATTVRLSERSVALMGSNIYAVEVIVTDKDAYFWKPPSGNVLHTKFFRRHHRTDGLREIYMDDFGPFEIPITIELTDRDYRMVEGVALRAHQSCSTECDSYVTLHRLRVPPGLGAVAVEMHPKHFGQIKLFAAQNGVPSYSEMDKLKPHHRSRIEIKFSNQELISFFYVAVISAKEAVYNYEMKVLLSSCAYYESEEWQSQKCMYKATVRRKYGNYSTVCHCDHLSVVSTPNASAWLDYILKFPSPKLPYFSDIVLIGTLKDNWYVLAVVVGILVLYIILLVYGGIEDRLDHRKESLMELSDNYPGDTHPYIIIVATGMRCRAGTSSSVGFQVIGSNSRTRPHVFRAAKARTLQVAQDDWFLLFTRYNLGDIKEILLWHNNSGCSTDWYCSQITVYDVHTDTPYAFIVQRWFKIDPKNLDDSRMWIGHVNKIDWEVKETKPLKVFGDRFITSLREKHLWFSIFLRHPRSRYSRCERVATLGSLLFCTMLTSIIFFGSGDYVEVPGVSVSLNVKDVIEMAKGIVISILTGSMLAFATLFLFRVSKPKIQSPPLPEAEAEEEKKCSKCCRRRKKKPPRVIYRPVVTEAALKERDHAPVPQKLQNLRIAAWIISFSLIFVMSFFIILYGLRFGKKRSLLWIQTFVGSTVADAMVMAPLKMAIAAYLLARIGLKAHVHDFSMQIDPSTLWPSPLTYMQRMDRMWCRLRKEYKPPSSRRLLKMSRSRAASDFFQEYIMYFLFLGTLFTFSFFFVVKFNTQSRFLATTTLMRQLSERKTEGVYAPDEIIVDNELADYINKTLLVALHRHRWYNGELLEVEPSEKRNGSSLKPDNERKGWCIGYLNKLIGVPRIRQQRISLLPKKIINPDWPDKFQYEIATVGVVHPYFEKYFNYSLGMLTTLNEDTRTYKVGWELYNQTRDGNLTNLWEYSGIEKTATGPHVGRLRRPYQGKGYVKLLYWTREESARRFFETYSAHWIDNRTRAVMVEVTFYNVHLNMFTQFVVLAERLPAGVFSVRTLIDTTSILIPDTWTNTEMIMTYILILLLLVYSIYYFIQVSMHGVQAVMSWAGLFNLCTIIVGLIGVVNHNFDKATRSDVFADSLDITPKDQFVSVYAYFFQEGKAQMWSGIFVLLITACAACAVHRLLGYERFTMIFVPIRPLFLMTILINVFIDFHSSACYDTLGLSDLSFSVVDGFFKSIPYQSLQRISPQDQLIVIFFLPLCFVFMKTVLGAVIFYYDRAADEGTQNIGIAEIFPRRASDKELNSVLDKQDRVLEKKMAAVTKKIMQISKKQKKQKKKHKGELYFAPERNTDAVEEIPAAGWLESVWGAEHQVELAGLKEESFPEAPLPQELLDDPNLQSLLESETSQPPKRPSDETPKEEKKQSPEVDKPEDAKKRSTNEDKHKSGVTEKFEEDKKLPAGEKKSKDDKKPSFDSQKGRLSMKPKEHEESTKQPEDEEVYSDADSQPKKSIEAKGSTKTDPTKPEDTTKIVQEPVDATKGPLNKWFKPKKTPQSKQLEVTEDLTTTKNLAPSVAAAKDSQAKESIKPTEQPKPDEPDVPTKQPIDAKPSINTKDTKPIFDPKQSVTPTDANKSEKTAGRAQPVTGVPTKTRLDNVRPTQFEAKYPRVEKSQPSPILSEVPPVIPASQPKTLAAVPPPKAQPAPATEPPKKSQSVPAAVPPQKAKPTPSKAPVELERPETRPKSNVLQEPEAPTKATGLNTWFKPKAVPQSKEPKVTGAETPTVKLQPVPSRPEERPQVDKVAPRPKLPPPTAASQTTAAPESKEPKVTGAETPTVKHQPGPSRPEERPQVEKVSPRRKLPPPTAAPQTIAAPQSKEPKVTGEETPTVKPQPGRSRPEERPQVEKVAPRPKPPPPTAAPQTIAAPESKEPKVTGAETPTVKPHPGPPRPEERPQVEKFASRSKLPPPTAAPQTVAAPHSSVPPRPAPTNIKAGPSQSKIPPRLSRTKPSAITNHERPAARGKSQSMSQPLPDQPAPSVEEKPKTKPDPVPLQHDRGAQEVQKSRPIPPRSEIPLLSSRTSPEPVLSKTPPEPKRTGLAPRGQPVTQSKVQPPPPIRLKPQTVPKTIPDAEKPVQQEKPPPPPSRIPPPDRRPQTEPTSIGPKKQLRFPPAVTARPETGGTKDSRMPPNGVLREKQPEQPSDDRPAAPEVTGVSPRGRRRGPQPVSWFVRNSRRLAARQRRRPPPSRMPPPEPGRAPRPPDATGPGVPGPAGIPPPRQVGRLPSSRSPTTDRPGESPQMPVRAGHGAPISVPPRFRRPRPAPRQPDEPAGKKPRLPDATPPAASGPSGARPYLGPRPQAQRGAPRVPRPPIRRRARRNFFDWFFRR